MGYDSDPKSLLNTLEKMLRECNPMNFDTEEVDTMWLKVMDGMLGVGKIENLVLWHNIEKRLIAKQKRLGLDPRKPPSPKAQTSTQIAPPTVMETVKQQLAVKKKDTM